MVWAAYAANLGFQRRFIPVEHWLRGGCLLVLDPYKCHRSVVRFWQQNGKYFALSQSKTHAALYSASCLAVPQQDKVTKYLCQTSFPPRPYHLKMNRDAMLAMLELNE